MYSFYGKVNWGHVVCPLYGGGLYLEESIMGGSTVRSDPPILKGLIPHDWVIVERFSARHSIMHESQLEFL